MNAYIEQMVRNMRSFFIAYRGGTGGASADYAFLYFPGVIPLYFLNVLIK